MGCGSSLNQVSDYNNMTGSSKPLRLDEMLHNTTSLQSINKIYLFGETQTKRKVLQLSSDEKSETFTLKKISQRYHIPRPKIQRDTIQMMYEQAQQVLPLNVYNSTTLPPFNLMFVTLLNQKVLFLCGGVDFQFWNVCSESFLYKIMPPSSQQDKLIKVKLQKPQTNIITQKTTNLKENTSRRTFNKFQRLAFMNQARYSHMGLSIKHPISGKNFVYVFGGFGSNKETLKSCQVYSFQKNLWEKIPDIQIPRATGFCFQYLQKIYVCGGFTSEGKRSKKIQVWDLQTQKWTVINIKLHQGIQQGIITSFSPNQIAIIGGNIEGGSTQSVIRFNMIEETYKWDSDVLHSDSLQKAINHTGKIYLFGGKKPGVCQIYNSVEKSWVQTKVLSSEEIRSGQLTMFSASMKPLIVDFTPITNRKRESEMSVEDVLMFGTDFYPILYFYNGKDLSVASSSVSMKLRLRKTMGVLRLSEDEYFLCGGIDTFGINSTKATFNYKVSSKSVEELDKMPLKKCKFGLVKHKNHIYSIGGSLVNEKREQIDLKSCCRYNLLTKKWQKLPDLNFHRSQCQVVETQTGLLVFGGYADGYWVDKIQLLNTQQNKNMQFKVLLQKLPLMFPMYSKVLSTKKDPNHNQKILKLFILNRNIHTSNFEEIYFSINVNKTSQNGTDFQNSSKEYNMNLNTLQQFDSIDVIITERQKTLDKQDSKTINEDRNTKGIKEEDEAQNNSEENDVSESTLVHKVESRVPQSNKVIKDSTQKIFKEEPNLLSVQTIMIKSKHYHDQFDQIQNKKGTHNTINHNIHHQKTEKDLNTQQISLEFERINLNPNKRPLKDLNEPFKIASTNDISQKYEAYENLKSEPMEEHQSMEKQGTHLPLQSQISESRPEQSLSFEPCFIEGTSKKVVKGLECIDSINDWTRIRETVGWNRVVFIKNDEMVKCNFMMKSSQQVKINVIREKYENGDLLFDKTNNQTHKSKLHTAKLKQNYA